MKLAQIACEEGECCRTSASFEDQSGRPLIKQDGKKNNGSRWQRRDPNRYVENKVKVNKSYL